MEGIPFYQPALYSTIIGYEAEEQERRSCFGCSKGFYADVAFVQTVPGRDLYGRVATTNLENICSTDTGDSGDCRLDYMAGISGAGSYYPVGYDAFKTGRTTGTTGGRISRTCVDQSFALRGENQLEDDEYDVQLLCQNEIRANSAVATKYPLIKSGDSGSMVYTYGVPLGQQQVIGIAWGGNSRDSFFYSPWENIIDGQRAGGRGIPVVPITESQGIVRN
jgi:hypothetical protein